MSNKNNNKENHEEYMKYRKLFQWLCEYCENVNLKLQAINKLADTLNRKKLKMLDKYQAVDQTLCNKADGIRFHELKCVDRECNNCGTSQNL